MKLTITHQESYSRGELLLRTFFGFFYIILPHLFFLFFFGIGQAVLHFLSFWVVLFTGKYPKSFFEYQVAMLRWNIRLTARLMNLTDGYPAFFLSGTDTVTSFDMPYPERLSRGLMILRFLFASIYVAIPHGFILLFRFLWTMVLVFVAWWVVLFTGKYPLSMHTFVVGTIRWSTRVNTYLLFLTDDYPPFTGKEV